MAPLSARPQNADAEQIIRLATYATSFEAFAADCLHIANEDKKIVPLELSETQRIIVRLIQAVRDMNQPVRLIVLKARQVYMSTILSAIAFHMHLWADGPTRTALIGDVYASSQNLERMMRLFYDALPEDIRYHRPLKYESTLQLLDSRAFVDVLTAKRLRAGQGGTYTTVIATEAPYYAHAADVFLSLLQAVPELPGTLVALEGTAAGYDPFFHPKWVEAMDRAGQLCARYGATDPIDLILNKGVWGGGFIPVFFPWHIMGKYRVDPDTEGVSEKTLTDVEKAIRDTYRLDLAQIAWRRYCIREKCGRSEEKFKQEFPASWEEAFQFAAGHRPVFEDVETVDRMLEVSRRESEKGSQRARIVWAKDREPLYTRHGVCENQTDLRAQALRDRYGDVWIRRIPRHSHRNRYVIGADVAEGLAQGDYSACYVYDRVDDLIVAGYRGHLSPGEYGTFLAQLGTYYNRAWILVERNNHGIDTLSHLTRIYINVLGEQRIDRGRTERASGDPLGILTTSGNKPHLVGLIGDMIKGNPRAVLDPQFWSEARTFTRDERGRMSAEGKLKDPSVRAYDDCVMAMAHTLKAHHLAPLPTAVKPRPMTATERQRTGAWRAEEKPPSNKVIV